MSLTTCSIALLSTLVAAITDTRTGRIPNWLTYSLLALAPLLSLVEGGLTACAYSLLGMVVCALVPLLLFTRNAMGGGDLKLFAGLGGLLGPHFGIEVEFFAFCVVAFVLFARMAWDGRLFATLRNVIVAFGHLTLPKRFHRPLEPTVLTEMRMGLSIFLATLGSVAFRTPYVSWLS